MSAHGPGSLARYAEIKKATTHDALRAGVQQELPPAKEKWRTALLDVGDQAEALAESCRREARQWEQQGRYDFAERLYSEADRHDIRAADWGERAEW